jgi:hypothetical protein
VIAVSAFESRPVESGHAPVNGIHMYYEVHGRTEGIQEFLDAPP